MSSTPQPHQGHRPQPAATLARPADHTHPPTGHL